MCEPVTIGALAAAGAIKAYGEYEAGQAESEMARGNARLLEARAADAYQRGGHEAGLIRTKGTRTNAEAKVALAKGNVELTSPMATNLFETTGMYSELDAQTARANAAREAWGLKAEAEEQRWRAKMAKRRGILAAAGTLAGTGASIYGIAATPAAGASIGESGALWYMGGGFGA